MPLYQYWVVWCVGGGSPTVKHGDKGEAEREAERLAELNPGRRFAVLECVGEVRKATTLWDYPEELPELLF